MRRVASRKRHFSLDRRRAAVTAAVFAGLLALALLGATMLVGIGSPASPPPVTAREGGTDHRLGALVVVHPGGRTCEVEGFDNTTGQLFGLGSADCDRIFRSPASNAIPPLDSKARLQAIQKTFQK